MIKKYVYVSILVLMFFFLGVDKASAVESCVCYLNGTSYFGTGKNFTVTNINGNISSPLIGSYTAKGYYVYGFMDPVIGKSTINTIKKAMEENQECMDKLYVILDGSIGAIGETRLIISHNFNAEEAADEFSCSELSSESSKFRSGELFDELFSKLESSKEAYEQCLNSSCSKLDSLKQQFENDLDNMEQYRHDIYHDESIDHNVYSDLFFKVDEIYRSKYDEWVASGLIEDYAANCSLISNDLEEKIIWFLDLIKYGGVILAIGLGMLDFLKAVLSDEGDANKKAIQRFIKRLIAAGLIFLLPLIIQFLITVVNINGVDTSNPFCVELR